MLRKNLSTEDTEGTDRWELDGIFLGSLRLEILEEIFVKNGRGPEIIMDPRKTRRAQIIGNLSTEDTEDTDGWELDGIILGSLRLEILEEIFNNKIWPGARNNLSLK